jgi:hypothetical protein
MPPAAADQDGVVRLVLAELRCAYLRAKSAEMEIQQVSELLKFGAIDAAEALRALEDMGWVGFLGADIRQLVEAAKAKGARGAHAK